MQSGNTGRWTMTIEEVATALGIDRSTAYELAAIDQLPAPVIRLGRRMVIGRVALERALVGDLARGQERGHGNA